MRKAMVITLGDLGDISNLKSNQSEAIINALKLRGFSVEVLCRDYRNYNGIAVKRILPFGSLIPKFLTFFQNFFRTQTRYFTLRILDIFSSLRLKKNLSIDITVPALFPITIKKAKKMGITTIIYEDVAHPKVCEDIMVNEYPDYKAKRERIIILNHVDYVLTLSEFAKNSYIKEGFKDTNILLAQTGVDVDRFIPKTCEDKIFRVTAVAYYDRRKGFQYLLEAWSELNLKDSELILVGDPIDDMERITKIFQTKLHNLKIRSNTDPLPYYQKASIYVFPSLLEGSSKTIYEAMACGLPVICTYESGSVVREGIDGFIIPARDKDAIKEKILYFYNNPDKIKVMGDSARQRIVENYQWKDFSKRVAKELEKIK